MIEFKSINVWKLQINALLRYFENKSNYSFENKLARSFLSDFYNIVNNGSKPFGEKWFGRQTFGRHND